MTSRRSGTGLRTNVHILNLGCLGPMDGTPHTYTYTHFVLTASVVLVDRSRLSTFPGLQGAGLPGGWHCQSQSLLSLAFCDEVLKQCFSKHGLLISCINLLWGIC